MWFCEKKFQIHRRFVPWNSKQIMTSSKYHCQHRFKKSQWNWLVCLDSSSLHAAHRCKKKKLKDNTPKIMHLIPIEMLSIGTESVIMWWSVLQQSTLFTSRSHISSRLQIRSLVSSVSRPTFHRARCLIHPSSKWNVNTISTSDAFYTGDS
jgi:hypothetical protein